MHFHDVAHRSNFGGLMDFTFFPQGCRKVSSNAGDQSERGVEKRRRGRGAFKPYRKPTQVDKRKYAKVNG